jgi:hypothetical protein
MNILYIGDPWNGDDSFLEELARIPSLRGHAIKTSMQKRDNATAVSLLCQQHKIDAVITSQASLLEAALRQLPDFVPPPGKKKLSLDDYAGSFFTLPRGIPILIVNPLERLNSVPYERFLLDRYISKITAPSSWHVNTLFKWKQVTPENAEECMAVIAASDLTAVDTETIDEGVKRIDLCCWSTYRFDTKEHHTYVVHVKDMWALRFMREANKTAGAKIMQNGQYDAAYFARWNCMPDNWLYDTLTLMHSWYSELPKRLDFIASFALREIRYWKDDGKTGSLEDKMRYNALDGWATLNSWLSLVEEAPKWAIDNYLQEFPMNFPSLNAALEGIAVDKEQFDKVKEQKEAEAESILAKLRRCIGSPSFNPRSPPQMKALFTVLGCGNLPDTAKASVLKARAASPLNDLLLGYTVKYKEAAKLISSYLDYDKMWNGRWLYAIDPAGTDTGRSASKSSAFWCGNSIQTIPRGDSIKSFLIADTGWLLAEADKAQSEARCVGYMAGDTNLINLVESSHDYHAWNAQAFFGIKYELIYDEATGKTLLKEIRDLSKRTNHGANYNMGPDVMLDTMGPKMVAEAKLVLKLPVRMRLRDVCAYLLQRYEETYPGVKGTFYDSIIKTIELTSKLVSPLGWTRFFFARPSKKNKPALNAAVAHGPQNLSVSILNREWYAIWRETIYGVLRNQVRIKAQIHDSIFFQYRQAFDPKIVLSMMNTPVQVTGADGVTRTMLIPSDLKCGDIRWSNLK